MNYDKPKLTEIKFEFLQFYVFRVSRGPFIEDFYQCVTYGTYTAVWQEQIYNMFNMFTLFVIPLGILLLSYLNTFKSIKGLAHFILNFP